ncbi:hypothetical protein S7335_3172 [Synechococcus sp. PCC 7335]|nr:hypothetical protein S7335_3172 [Synechococcus sp. PCC 7335]
MAHHDVPNGCVVCDLSRDEINGGKGVASCLNMLPVLATANPVACKRTNVFICIRYLADRSGRELSNRLTNILCQR